MTNTAELRRLLACADCDALYRRPVLPVGSTARCARCGSVLLRNRRGGIQKALAFALAGLILFVPANTLTVFSFGLHGLVQPTTITGCSVALSDSGYAPLGALIFFASVLAPLLLLLLIVYVTLPVSRGRLWPGTIRIFHFYETLRTWAMLSVFLLGAFVAIVKMADYGDMVLGHGFYAFMALLLVTTAAQASLEPDDFWRGVEAAR